MKITDSIPVVYDNIKDIRPGTTELWYLIIIWPVMWWGAEEARGFMAHLKSRSYNAILYILLKFAKHRQMQIPIWKYSESSRNWSTVRIWNWFSIHYFKWKGEHFKYKAKNMAKKKKKKWKIPSWFYTKQNPKKKKAHTQMRFYGSSEEQVVQRHIIYTTKIC